MFGRLFESMRGREGESELPEGLRLEVLKQNGDLYFVGSLDWAKKGTYQVRNETGDLLPPIEYGATVKLRGRYQEEAIFVEGKIVGNSAEVWRVEQVKVVRGADQRAFFRQNSKIGMMLTCGNDLRGDACGEKTPQGKYFPGVIVNLSAGGAQIVTTADFEKTDWISVIDAVLVPEEEPFTFLCAIRRKAVWEEDATKFVYGCEFLEVGAAEQDRLIKAILMLQRKEIRSRRGGRAL